MPAEADGKRAVSTLMSSQSTIEIPGAHAPLRTATAADHARVDAAFAGFDLARADSYIRFLKAHAVATLTVESLLDEAGFAAQLPDWPRRRRGALLLGDLAELDARIPLPNGAAVDLSESAACWGAAYVLEGSRLGGRVLARRVGAGLPRRYLDAGTADWKTFLVALDAGLSTAAAQRTAIGAACTVFALYEAAAWQALEPDTHD